MPRAPSPARELRAELAQLRTLGALRARAGKSLGEPTATWCFARCEATRERRDNPPQGPPERLGRVLARVRGHLRRALDDLGRVTAELAGWPFVTREEIRVLRSVERRLDAKASRAWIAERLGRAARARRVPEDLEGLEHSLALRLRDRGLGLDYATAWIEALVRAHRLGTTRYSPKRLRGRIKTLWSPNSVL